MNYQAMPAIEHKSFADLHAETKARKARMAEAASAPSYKAHAALIAENKQLHAAIAELRRCLSETDCERQGLERKVSEQAQTILRLEGVERIMPNRTPVQDIIENALSDYPGVSFSEVRGRGQHPLIQKARIACVYAVHTLRPDMSFPHIGRVFERDHTTIINTVKRAKTVFVDQSANDQGRFI